ncbi:hypothetical protein [Protofrankia coriariae]|uniref:hypothetical protein n=1 Tax=Protofrankia coriariae TaxID=1562887 RepID=UPI000AD1CAFF|nr:hypothetical protein [Protofrankia coriariae]
MAHDPGLRHPRGGNRNSSGGKNSGARLLGSEGPGSEARGSDGSGHGTRGNGHTSRRRADGRGERTVWERIAESQDGVISVRTALRAGMTEAEIRWKLRSGRWQRPMRGVLVTHSGPITDAQMMWAAVESVGAGAVLGGASAASFDGLRGFDGGPAVVLVDAARHVTRRPGVIIRRSHHLGSDDVYPRRSPPRTRLPRSVVDMASWAPDEEDARAVLAAAVQQRLVTVAELRRVVERRGPLRRNRLITDTLSDLGDGAHSVAEILYRKIENRYGLPAARRQPRIDAGGSRYHLDVWYETWRVWVEIDGGYHREVRQWWDDLARQNAGVLQDRLILRFPVHVLRTEPRLVAEQVATALRQRGWEPNL